jgi:hypothetical protein
VKRFLITLIFSLNFVFAQHLPYSLGLKTHHGFLVAHRPNMKHLPQEKSNVFEINIGKKCDGSSFWHQQYYLPEMSASILYGNIGNKEILGNFIGLYPQISFPLVGKAEPVLKLNFGVGAGYITKVFDRIENHKNNAISNHINVLAVLKLEHSLNVWQKRIFWNNAISIIHFSNGSTKVPNSGINIATFNSGFNYSFGNKETYFKTEKPDKIHQENINILVFLNGGRSEVIPADGQKFLAFSNTFSLQKRVSNKNIFSAGTDLFFSESAEKKIRSKGGAYNGLQDNFQFGFHLGYTLDMDKVHLFMNNGVYIYDKTKLDGSFYHRFGMRYLLSNKWMVNASLKTHFAKAQHFELGFGYSIFSK